MLLSTIPSQVLSFSKDGDSAVCLGNQFQCLTILTVKVFSYTLVDFSVFHFAPTAL